LVLALPRDAPRDLRGWEASVGHDFDLTTFDGRRQTQSGKKQGSPLLQSWHQRPSSTSGQRLRTDEGCHCAPRGVRICCPFNPAAIWPSEAAPSALRSATVDARLWHDRRTPDCHGHRGAVPLAGAASAAAPFGLPSRMPRALAAAKAAFVRAAMASRSCCATSAMTLQ
jgi:hypothetical protein